MGLAGILFGLLFLSLFLGVPIAISLGVASGLTMFITGNAQYLASVPTRMFTQLVFHPGRKHYGGGRHL